MAKVLLSLEAITDLVEIYQYIYDREGEEQAEAVLNYLEERAAALDKLCLRGKLPDELAPFGNTRIRELQAAPWRIFYRPDGDELVVLSIIDGRRNIMDVLLERLAR